MQSHQERHNACGEEKANNVYFRGGLEAQIRCGADYVQVLVTTGTVVRTSQLVSEDPKLESK